MGETTKSGDTISKKFNRSFINKYVINKNPDAVFIGDLIIITNSENDITIPVYLYGGKEPYEKVTQTINILVYEKSEYETKEQPQPLYTTTANENLEFEIPQLEKTKEYRVVATTDKNWPRTTAKEFYLGQVSVKGSELENNNLTIYLAKYSR